MNKMPSKRKRQIPTHNLGSVESRVSPAKYDLGTLGDAPSDLEDADQDDEVLHDGAQVPNNLATGKGKRGAYKKRVPYDGSGDANTEFTVRVNNPRFVSGKGDGGRPEREAEGTERTDCGPFCFAAINTLQSCCGNLLPGQATVHVKRCDTAKIA
jgi:hypothetical protein